MLLNDLIEGLKDLFFALLYMWFRCIRRANALFPKQVAGGAD